MNHTIRIAAALIALGALVAFGCTKSDKPAAPGDGEPQAEAPADKLVLFSWWTAGGEAEGLADILNLFKQKRPDAEVVNAAVAGGAGTNAKAVLKTRMLGGDPPDTFQVHGGAELIETWVKPGLMTPLDDLYAEEGFADAFPKALIDMVSYEGKPYSVPSNVRHGNVLYYNVEVLKNAGVEPPKTMGDFFAAAEKLKAAGVTPLALASRNKWPVTHLFETILLATGGPEFYNNLFAGKIAWTDERVVKALGTLARMTGFINRDHAALTWDQACGLVQQGKAAMTVMGDWAKGYFMTNGFAPVTQFDAVHAPGTDGGFIVVTDTFGIPKGAPHPETTRAFLSVLGSEEGQIAFNLRMGSIPARKGVAVDRFDPIAKRTIQWFTEDALVPSLAHGSAAPELFVTAINDELGAFIQDPDPGKTAGALEAAAQDAGIR